MREYELMYIVRPSVSEDQLPAVNERVDTFIGNLGGEMRERNAWGKRRLAYEIEKHGDGYYFVTKVMLDPERVTALEEQLRIYDEVIRHMVVAHEEPKPVNEKKKPVAEPAQA